MVAAVNAWLAINVNFARFLLLVFVSHRYELVKSASPSKLVLWVGRPIHSTQKNRRARVNIIRSIKWLFKSKKINWDQDVPFNSSERKSHVLKSSDENRRLTLDEALKSRPVLIGHQGRDSPRNFSSDPLYRELIKRLIKRNDLMLREGQGSKGMWTPGFSESAKQEGDL